MVFWLKFQPRFVFEGVGDGSSCKSIDACGHKPCIMLPFIWFQTKKIPVFGAWLGASLVVIGSWIIIQ